MRSLIYNAFNYLMIYHSSKIINIHNYRKCKSINICIRLHMPLDSSGGSMGITLSENKHYYLFCASLSSTRFLDIVRYISNMNSKTIITIIGHFKRNSIIKSLASSPSIVTMVKLRESRLPL